MQEPALELPRGSCMRLRLERMLLRLAQRAGSGANQEQESDAQSALESHHCEKTAAGWPAC